MLTLAGVIVLDVLPGLIIGVVLSILLVVYRDSRIPLSVLGADPAEPPIDPAAPGDRSAHCRDDTPAPASQVGARLAGAGSDGLYLLGTQANGGCSHSGIKVGTVAAAGMDTICGDRARSPASSIVNGEVSTRPVLEGR
jgi:hypothetical protein